ncbi:MAG TPA: LysE family transporter [Armatimonadota bacterium]|jgi:threonine/homoserine/homoserine lactone efflux protein
MLNVFLLSLAVGFSGAIIPGPLLAVTINQALRFGWTAGLWIALGHAVTELVLVGGLRAGLGGLLQRRWVRRIIGTIGGVVLLYFAWGMFATALDASALAAAQDSRVVASRLGLFGVGVLLTVTQPYWYLWWATAGVGLIAAQSEQHGTRAWPAFYVGHILADILWYVIVSTLIALGRGFMSPAVHRAIILVCAVGVAVLGVYFLYRQYAEWRDARKAPPALEPIVE